MNTRLTTLLLSAAAVSAAYSKGLYYVPNDTEETIPLSWTVGVSATYDDNTSPGGATDGDETMSLNPYVGLSFVSVTPQTTWDVYARLGVVYYFDEPAGASSEDLYTQAKLGVNLTHRFSERLRLVSRNFVSYELEPDYSYGFATTRQLGEYLYYQTDNALGFRWTERFGTYTGFQVEGLSYDDVDNADRLTWTLYNQFRYQISPQTVATASYRYSQTQGEQAASDSTNHYILGGFEHSFSPSTVLIVEAGAQIREVDSVNGDSSANPYVQIALNTRVNQQFSLSGFLRYGAEDYDTVFGAPAYQFENRMTLRIGVTGEYQISQALSLFGGVNVINTSYEDGRFVDAPFGTVADADETLVNAYIGTSVKITDTLYGSFSYNFTNSDSDNPGRDYDRNRITVGLNAEF
ncbi:hypothetical protein [Luteolibacter sp. AS25]|uniref:hypothetical protein n=1 Tax=Luteolibacter sp. AS25 TaxID=3135776 RepID=UPI00398BAC2D